ncbi:MAG: hypothetical protein KJ944_17940, partial [Alphaproteobacteria bacterium]|nr:hypothetical protein [Alphaproteobacteria bacterium]
HRRLVFHSFRNNFNDAMRVADVPVEIREAINGWSNRNAMDARYGQGHSTARLYTEICKVRYEGLKTVNGGVKAGQCGGVKAGHWQGCDADMEMAPIGAISMSASSFSIRDR